MSALITKFRVPIRRMEWVEDLEDFFPEADPPTKQMTQAKHGQGKWLDGCLCLLINESESVAYCVSELSHLVSVWNRTNTFTTSGSGCLRKIPNDSFIISQCRNWRKLARKNSMKYKQKTDNFLFRINWWEIEREFGREKFIYLIIL